MLGEKIDMIEEIYLEYIKTVSSKSYAISLELSYLLLQLMSRLKASRILELGTGWSSYVFRQGKAEVWSIDTDTEWMEKTCAFLLKHKCLNGHFCLLEDFKFENKYDLVLVDIKESERLPSFPFLKKCCSGVIVFDDAHWEDYPERIRKAFRDWTLVDLKKLTLDSYGRYAYAATQKYPEILLELGVEI